MSDKNNCFKEAVCIEVPRVFDSCSDRDCIYELPVTLSEESPAITDEMNIVRTRCVEVEATCISVDSVPFKSGYYSVDITYRFKITAEAFSQTFCQPQSGTLLCGTALWNKRVILYGGEGNAKVFTSDQDFVSPLPLETCDCVLSSNNAASMPKVTIHVVDPVALEAKFVCLPVTAKRNAEIVAATGCCCCSGGEMPTYEKVLTVSLGLFSIVQLSRPVSLIVPAYDYCIPCKECTLAAAAEAPCDVFDRIEFPTDQFFPQPSGDNPFNCGCNNSNNSNNSCNCNNRTADAAENNSNCSE